MSTKPYEGDTQVEIRDRVRRIEVRLTNFIKHMGFAPIEERTTKTDIVVGVSADGDLVASNSSVTIGELFFAAQRNNMRGEVPVYVGNRYFGVMRTTRE
jgi:hypothetical protein